MNTKLFCLSLAFALSLFHARGQEFASMKHGLKIELGLPIAQTNPAFKEFIQGVVYTHINYQYRFLGNDKFSPIAGIGISSNYLDVANYKIVGLNQGGLFSYGGFGKVGLEVIHDENKIVDYHVKMGYFFMDSRNKQTPNNIAFSSSHQHLFIEPGVNFSLMLDDRQGVSFNVSYTLRDMRFRSFHLMIPELPGFVGANLNGLTGHINFGFGYTLYLQKPKDALE
jgi:hypothetical protein